MDLFISKRVNMVTRIKPEKGQESVWDYPRPPRCEAFPGHIRIVFDGEPILDTNKAYRVLETSHPPTYYLPIADFKPDVLLPVAGTSYCEFKGQAAYYEIKTRNKTAPRSAWGYPNAKGSFSPIREMVAVYAHMMDSCYVNDEKVQAQEGDFYGGWITSNIVGPFKGGTGTWGW